MSTPSQRRLQSQDLALPGAPSWVQRSLKFSRLQYIVTIVSLATISLLLGLAAFYLTPTTGTTAIWWPAAGTSAVLVMVYRGPRWQAILIVATTAGLANLLIGRPISFALGGMIVIAIEIAVFAAVLGPLGGGAILARLRGLVRFVFAVLAASLSVGVTGAIMFIVLVGADPLVTFSAVVPSHLSALVLIAPLALIPLPQRTPGQGRELAAQIVTTGSVVLAVFWPGQHESIGVLIVPLLGWAAARFRPIVSALEVVALGVLVSVLTVLGGGPFAIATSAVPASLLVQIYLLSISTTMLFLTVSRSERAELRAENERSAAILRGGFVGSQVGSLFIRADPHAGPSIIEMNGVAQELVDGPWFDELAQSWIRSGDEEFSTDVTLDNGHTVKVYGRRVSTSDGDTVLAIQLVDVTSLILAQETLKKTVALERKMVEELREMAVQKDDFVSAVSHELRTPITSIVGFAEELYETASEEQREYAAIIVRNATRLTAMVEELLEIGRLTSRNPVRETLAIEISPVIRESIEDQSVSARERGITVATALSSEPIFVVADGNAIARIVTNLLSNAIKFTPAGGQVTLTTMIDTSESTMSLIVDDSGPGISDDDVPHIFERFFRSSHPERRKTPGTGLGLSIVKALVEALGGAIDVDRSPHGGARITVSLPTVRERSVV